MKERIFNIAHYADAAVLYLLITLCVLSAFLIFDRYFKLKKISKQSKKIQNEIEQSIYANQLSVVTELAKQTNTIQGRVCAYGLSHLEQHGIDGFDEIFNSLINIEKARLEKSLGFLATVGSNAPYIGLFGTVLGIMKSFQDMNNSNAGQGAVMAGISAALIATAAGLMVAIPSVLSYNYFQKQVKNIMLSFATVRDLILARAKIIASTQNKSLES